MSEAERLALAKRRDTFLKALPALEAGFNWGQAEMEAHGPHRRRRMDKKKPQERIALNLSQGSFKHFTP